MDARLDKFLLLLLIAALAVAPMRMAFTMPVSVSAGANSHCARMQDGPNSAGHAAGMKHDGADHAGSGCDHGCKGDCCDGACVTCAHVMPALPGSVFVSIWHDTAYLSPSMAQRVTAHSPHPPFRPPISFS